MSEDAFQECVKCLENAQKDSSQQYTALMNIRKNVEWPRHKDNIEKLRKSGSLKFIVPLLHSPKKYIVDVALSILGNCCLDSKCSKAVVTLHNILPVLNQTLKRYPQDNSINGRVFRIVGNLCQQDKQWVHLLLDKKPQIIIHTVKFLKDDANKEDTTKLSEATIVMGLRAVRELFSRDCLTTLLETYEVLNMVGLLLIKYSTLWEKTKSHENILSNLLKFLQKISCYKHYPALLQLRNTEKGDSVVYLSKILMISPRQVVKIVMNFLGISHLKSDLPVPEIFNTFIDFLRKNNITQEFNKTCEDCIKCLCQLMEHPLNRQNERCGESIPLLVHVLSSLTLQTAKTVEYCILIVSILQNCKYSISLLQEQISCDIVKVLTDKLKDIGGNIRPLNYPHKLVKKRKRECNHKSALESYSCSSRSPSSSDSEAGALSYLSGLSPKCSPTYINEDSVSDSDDYSPVCSEVDTSEFPLPNLEEESSADMEITNDLDDFRPTEMEALDSDRIKREKHRLLTKICRLIQTYARQLRVPQLGTPELLLAMLKAHLFCCIESPTYFNTDRVYIAKVMNDILGTHEVLIPLLQTDFIPQVYSMREFQHTAYCSICTRIKELANTLMRDMTATASSEAGRGEIAHKLQRAENTIKQQLVSVIPYVISDRAILVELMLKCGGLEVLIEVLQSEDAELKQNGIKVLCIMASETLQVPNPKDNVSSSTLYSCKSVHKADVVQSVVFKLDDGSSLSADRVLLSSESDFFSRMLNGGFKESQENEIRLTNVGHKSLKSLLHLLEHNMKQKAVAAVDLSTLLEVIVLCDRFLMADYCIYLTNCVQRLKLCSKNIPVIYQWSMESRTNLLRVESIAFALVGNIVDRQRLKMFSSLFQLGYPELIEDIKSLLLRFLSMKGDFQKKRIRRLFD